MTGTERSIFYEGGRWRALRVAVVVLLGLLLAAGVQQVRPEPGEPSAVEVGLAGDNQSLGERLGEGCSPWPQPTPSCLEAAALARDAVERDFWFVVAYVVAAGGLCLLGSRTAAGRRRTRRFLRAAAAAVLGAGLFDLIENAALLQALEPDVTFGRWIHVAAVAATIKWALAPLVAVGAVWAIVVFVQGRPEEPPVVTGPPLARGLRWDPRFAPDADDRFGICLSGGGVRSASFALGAIQRLEEGDPAAGGRSYLEGADYLTAVSGGAYYAGAAQLLAARHEAAATDGASPFRPFADGSAEQDHLRRHASYLADTASEWAAALGQTLGKLFANLVLLGLLIVAVAQPLGWMGRLLLGVASDATAPTDWPAIPEAVWWAVLLTAVPAVVLANGRRFQATEARGARGVIRRFVTPTAQAAGVAAAIIALTAIALPLLDGLGRRAPEWLKASDSMVGAAWPTAVLAALLGWLKTKAMKKETSGGAALEQGEDTPGKKKAGLRSRAAGPSCSPDPCWPWWCWATW